MRRIFEAALVVLLFAAPSARAEAQGANVLFPVDSIEQRLSEGSFRVIDRRESRGISGERTSRTALSFSDGLLLVVKWARAPRGGEEFNNSPQYELAAYEVQKLFLGEDDYVVPPTVVRAFPIEEYKALDAGDPDVHPTFRGTRSILAVLQYWLLSVTPENIWDSERYRTDGEYARHLGDFNVLTYLIRHSDSNTGNYLISTNPNAPRVFSVDNGIAFSSRESNRGMEWRRIRVDSVPAETVQRLRSLTREDVTRALETVAEFRVLPDSTLERVAPTPSFDGGRGVRRSGDRIQLGLTHSEIGALWRRIGQLLRLVDTGRIGVI